jgi:hypothetical protein
MATVWNSNIGKSNTNNLPSPTDLTENPYRRKKTFFKDATQKSATMILGGIAIELVPSWPDLKNVLVFEKKGGCCPKFGIFGIGCPVQYAETCFETSCGRS